MGTNASSSIGRGVDTASTILVEVMMHLALVGDILMIPLLAEVEQICCSSYCTREILLYFDILYDEFDVIYVHIYIYTTAFHVYVYVEVDVYLFMW